MGFIYADNAAPKSFTWTAQAQDIVASRQGVFSVLRFCRDACLPGFLARERHERDCTVRSCACRKTRSVSNRLGESLPMIGRRENGVSPEGCARIAHRDRVRLADPSESVELRRHPTSAVGRALRRHTQAASGRNRRYWSACGRLGLVGRRGASGQSAAREYRLRTAKTCLLGAVRSTSHWSRRRCRS